MAILNVHFGHRYEVLNALVQAAKVDQVPEIMIQPKTDDYEREQTRELYTRGSEALYDVEPRFKTRRMLSILVEGEVQDLVTNNLRELRDAAKTELKRAEYKMQQRERRKRELEGKFQMGGRQ
jgi:hypothetical protein